MASFLGSRDECPGSLCHSPGVGILVCVRVSICCVDKNFNLSHNFPTITDRDLMLYMCIPYDKSFHLVPLFFFTLWPWPWSLTHFWKTLTVAIIFIQEERFHMCISCDKTFHIVPWPWPWSLTYFWKNFNLGCYFVMVAARWASLSSDNSYYYWDFKLLLIKSCKKLLEQKQIHTL